MGFIMLKIITLSIFLLGCALVVCGQDRLVRVTAEKAALLGTADPAGVEVTTLSKGDLATVIQVQPDWHLIQTKKYVGWVESRHLSVVDMSGFSNGTGTGGGQGGGMGTGQGSGRDSKVVIPQREKPATNPDDKVIPLKILSKPRPAYTELARTEGAQGEVVLRVTFLANGTIGAISPVKGLPFGLTESAIATARTIRFEPQTRNGVPEAVTRSVTFTFDIY